MFNHIQKIIKSENKFTLRVLCEGDLRFVRELYTNSDVMTYIAEPLSQSGFTMLFNNMLKGMERKRALYFVIENSDVSRSVGVISAKWCPKTESIETGTIIAPEFQKMGASVWAQFAVMKEAIKCFPVKRCIVFVDKDNAAANASCRRIGFVLEENHLSHVNEKHVNQWTFEMTLNEHDR